MPRHLWIRVALVVLVIAGAIWYLYPPAKAINLGLDLQGGIHLVLRVDVDKALENVVERAASDVRSALEKKGIGAQVTRQGTALIVQLTSPQAFNDAQKVLGDFNTFTTRTTDATAGRVELALTENEAKRLRDFAVRQGVETIRNRVDQFGVSEPNIQRQGENRILVQLPGIQDPARAKALIGKTAVLEFKLIDEQADVDKALRDGPPPGDEILVERRVNRQTKAETKVSHVVKKRTILTGDLIQNAEVKISDSGEAYVSVTFNALGARVFGEVTEQNVGKRLAIVLDGNVHSAPAIRERIPSGQAQITGGFTPEEARDLAIVLRAGALPAPVQILEERTVGPSLGADSIRQGLIAITGSAVVVFVFMLVYYRLSGLVADVALGLNLLILFACMAAIRATLTLPGLAGIALTIGMAVDTNILIFERIREELRVGKTPRAAIDAGFRRALRTIVDTHLTVMGTAVILLSFGTSSVKGFGVSLFIGLGASLFTAYFFTRLLFDLLYMGRRKVDAISI